MITALSSCPDSHRCVGCEVVLSGIEEQVSRANQHKEQQLGLKQQIESEVSRQAQVSCSSAAWARACAQGWDVPEAN